MAQASPIKDHILMHGIVLIWGYTGIIGKWSELGAEFLVLLRMLTAFLALFLYSVLVAQKRTIAKNTIKQYLSYVLVGTIVAGHWVTFFGAIKAANVSVALACMASTSVFAALLEPIFFRRRFSLLELTTSIIAGLGILLIFDTAGSFYLGIILALISSLLGAIFTILNGKLLAEGGNATTITQFEMLGGCLLLIIYGLLGGFDLGAAIESLNTVEFLIAAFLGVVCTAIPFTLSIVVMRSLSPFTICLSTNLEPVYAIGLALLHFGDSERMNPFFYLAATMIIGSVIVNGLYSQYLKKKQTLT